MNEPIRIGGSEIACITGNNPFKSALRLYYEKTGILEGFTGNDRTRAGAEWEQPILQHWASKKGAKVIDLPELQEDVRYSDNLTIGAQIDGIVELDGKLYNVEVKTTSVKGSTSEWIPYPSYIEQAGWGLGKCRLLHSVFADDTQLIQGTFIIALAAETHKALTLYEYFVEYDGKWFWDTVALAEEFCKNTRAGFPPEMAYTEDEYEVQGLLPREHITIEKPELESLIREIKDTSELISQLEKNVKINKAKVISAMGNADECLAGSYRITYKQQTTKHQAKEAYESTFRVLRTKENK